MDFFFREKDGMILLCQDNDNKQVVIEAVNDIALGILGYAAEDESDVVGKDFSDILNGFGKDLLDSNLEYNDKREDLGEVLAKRRQIPAKNMKGESINLPFKILRAGGKGNKLWFRLILSDLKRDRQHESIQRVLYDNFKGHESLDEKTGLPDSESMDKNIEMAQYYVSSRDLTAFFAYIKINDSKHKDLTHQDNVNNTLKHVANSIQGTLRISDVIAKIDDDAIGVLLIGLKEEVAPIVINRLRSSIVHGEGILLNGNIQKLNVNIGFVNITSDIIADALANGCKQAIAENQDKDIILVE